MVGVKGRSGKVRDAAHHSAKRAAGRLAGLAKRDNQRRSDDAAEDQDHGDQPPAVSGARFAVRSWIDYKDYLACELQKEKIAAAKIEVETATTKRDVERGALMTRDQVRLRDEAHTAAIKEGLSSVTELLTAHVPPDRLLDAQKAAREWADRFLENLAAVLEGAK